MGAFNKTTKGKSAVAPTTNYEGAPAWTLSDKLELYSAVTTFMFQDNYYEKGGDRIQRIRELAKKVPPKFVAQLAIYSRETMHLRSVPLALVVELAGIHNGDSLVRRASSRVIQRADEIAEILAYYELANNRTGLKKLNKLSKQLQLGVADAFNKFNEYQFSKYDRDGGVKLRDALFLTHPKPKDQDQKAIFDRIASRTLQKVDTWEVSISAAGSSNEKKKEEWERLILEHKLGYMATLRNLRNIMEIGVSQKAIDEVCSFISNQKAVEGSKQFPFRFLSAYRELPQTFNTQQVQTALEEAMRHAAANVHGFNTEDRVVIAGDVSGSMQHPLSEKSKVMGHEAGLALGFILANRCQKVMVCVFGDTMEWVQFDNTKIINGIQQALTKNVGWCTNGYLVLLDLLKNKTVTDKVFFFTDMQLWNTAGYYNKDTRFDMLWHQYKSQVNDKAKLYIVDISGYGTTPINIMEPGVYYVSGFSERVFEVLETQENGEGAIRAIEEIEL